MSTLYDISCIIFQDSLLPMNRSYEGVTSLVDAVCRRWSSRDLDKYVVFTSDEAKDQGRDQHGIEWVKVSNPETSAIIELFVAYRVEEHTHVFLNLGEGFKCTCGLEDTDPELEAVCAEFQAADAEYSAAFDELKAEAQDNARAKFEAARDKCRDAAADYSAARTEFDAAWDEYAATL